MIPTVTGNDTRDSHLSADDIAALAEGRARGDLRASTLAHLSLCRTCMTTYADTVRYRAAWLAFPEAFEGPDSGVRPQLAAAPGPGRTAAWIAAACLVLALAALAGTFVVRGRARSGPPAEVVALLERASADGLVYPGGEAGALPSAPLYRSIHAAEPRVGPALDRLREAYERAPNAAFDFYPLAAGLLASGRADLAYDYISEGRRRAPEDHRLLLLAAIAAHEGGDLAEAERLLEAAVRRTPHDPVAMLDLGLVVAETRGAAAASTCLEDVIRKSPRSPLAERARRALAARPTP